MYIFIYMYVYIHKQPKDIRKLDRRLPPTENGQLMTLQDFCKHLDRTIGSGMIESWHIHMYKCIYMDFLCWAPVDILCGSECVAVCCSVCCSVQVFANTSTELLARVWLSHGTFKYTHVYIWIESWHMDWVMAHWLSHGSLVESWHIHIYTCIYIDRVMAHWLSQGTLIESWHRWFSHGTLIESWHIHIHTCIYIDRVMAHMWMSHVSSSLFLL